MKKVIDMLKRNTFGGGGYRILLIFFVMCFLIFSLWGCAARPGSEFYSKPGVNMKDIRKVAVLPLENLTSEELASEKVRRAVIAELLVKGIEVVEPGEITRAMRELNISSPENITGQDLQKLGEMLGVKAIMRGSVSSYGFRQGITANYPEVSIHLMLIDPSSDDILWSVWQTSGGPSFMTRHFGTEVDSLGETVKKVVREAINMLI